MEATCTPNLTDVYRVGSAPVVLCNACGAVVPVDARGVLAVVPEHFPRS